MPSTAIHPWSGAPRPRKRSVTSDGTARPPIATRAEQLIVERLLSEALRQLQTTLGAAPRGEFRVLTLTQLWREYEALRRSRRSAATWHITRFHKIISDRHGDRGLAQNHVARELGLSAFHLSRMINRETGRDFHWHLRMARVDHARRLLTSTRLKMHAIAAAAGFTTTSQRDHQFKAAVGMTPSAYREAHGYPRLASGPPVARGGHDGRIRTQ
jgi:AraC-like DNA-binding protein